MTLSTVDDSLYFMCNVEDFKFLADMIQHVPLPLRARYVFCCSPINRKMPFVCSMFLKVRVFAKTASNLVLNNLQCLLIDSHEKLLKSCCYLEEDFLATLPGIGQLALFLDLIQKLWIHPTPLLSAMNTSLYQHCYATCKEIQSHGT